MSGHRERILDESGELRELLIELARWSRVAERNGDLHARIASALARESSAADVDGAGADGHHESVGERQGRRPARDIWANPSASRERLRAWVGRNNAKSGKPSKGFEKADPLSDPTSGQGANAKPGLSDHA